MSNPFFKKQNPDPFDQWYYFGPTIGSGWARPTRIPTSADYYVDASIGNDGNDGLASVVAGGHGPTKTINMALAIALATDSQQGPINIHIAPGLYNENIAINGPIVGGISNKGFVGTLSEPIVNFIGAGSGVVTVDGANTVNGQAYAYAFLANQGACFSVAGMTIQATHGGPSIGTALYTQFHGYIHIVSDVVIGPCKGSACLGEEGGVFEVNPGGQTTALTFTGNATAAVALSAFAMFQADTTIIFNGPTYSTAAFALGQDTHCKLSGNPPISGTFFGPQLQFGGNSVLFTAAAATWPGTKGSAVTGGVWEGAYPQTTVTNQTGAGSTGGVAIDAGGDPYHGVLRITFNGTGIAAAGTIDLSHPYSVSSCAISLDSSGWNARASAQISQTSLTPHIIWDNNGVVPTGGSTFVLGYVGR